MPVTEIGQMIGKNRSDLKLTQDQYGRKYSVSGPAIFKFEKGFVKPSLNLWLTISKDLKLTEQTAVLIWAKAKLPRKFQGFIDIDSKGVAEQDKPYGRSSAQSQDKKLKEPETLRKEIISDRSTPKGLKQLLKDDDIWTLYKPKSSELTIMREIFSQFGDGSKTTYREALRLIQDYRKV